MVYLTDKEAKALYEATNGEIPTALDYRSACAKLQQAIKEKVSWENQQEPCSGSGYAHEPHGNCPGYTTDRT